MNVSWELPTLELWRAAHRDAAIVNCCVIEILNQLVYPEIRNRSDLEPADPRLITSRVGPKRRMRVRQLATLSHETRHTRGKGLGANAHLLRPQAIGPPLEIQKQTREVV